MATIAKLEVKFATNATKLLCLLKISLSLGRKKLKFLDICSGEWRLQLHLTHQRQSRMPISVSSQGFANVRVMKVGIVG